MTDDTVDITTPEREYTLDELSTLADVTPRTVRYYIVEGLLPPPLASGRNAIYGQEHLDRLNAIASLKEMYLPLREIRHRLNTLSPEQMRDPAYLATLSQAVAMDRAMGHHHGRSVRRAAMREEPASAAEYIKSLREPDDAERQHRAMLREQRHQRARQAPDPITQPASQTWERFPLGDDAELLIRSSKVQHIGPRLYRTLHKLRHMIETDVTDRERNRR